jgi:hypothetical protein
VQVLSAGGGPHFRLHIQPGNPVSPANKYPKAINRAGEGKGLQVYPGSVKEMILQVGCVHGYC